MRHPARRLFGLLVVLAAAIGVARPAAALDAASPAQQAILTLFFMILIFALIIGVLVHVLLLMAVKWYRDSPRWRPPKHVPKANDKRLEIAWTVGPVLILAAVFTLTWLAIPGIERPASYDYTIEVIGQQWAWRFAYPDWNATARNITSSGTMYIEQGVTFRLLIRSEDVIHSFYVPDLGIKIDAIPGVTNEFWVRADLVGTYTAQCAEFCGLGHSQMHGEVVVFRPGSQAIPYGPPLAPPTPGGGGSPTGAIVDVEFKESGGPSADRPWTIKPARINLGRDFNVTFRVWNNESGTHQFRIGDPYNIQGALLEGHAAQPDIINFRANTTGAVDYWCDISGHRSLGMEGLLNISGPQFVTVVLRDGSVSPARLDFGLGWTVNLTVRNNGANPHGFGIGPPYDFVLPAIPSGGSVTDAFVFNRTAPSTWFGSSDAGERAAGIQGPLTVLAAGAALPPPPAAPGFPIIEVTFGLTLVAGVAAIGFNMKLARDARRREQFPPEER